MPERIQRHRGKAMPKGAKYVGRPSRWGCPYVFRKRDAKAGRVLVDTREEAIGRFEADLRSDPERVAAAREELAGHDLACYCPLDVWCHADVLLEVANS